MNRIFYFSMVVLFSALTILIFVAPATAGGQIEAESTKVLYPPWATNYSSGDTNGIGIVTLDWDAWDTAYSGWTYAIGEATLGGAGTAWAWIGHGDTYTAPGTGYYDVTFTYSYSGLAKIFNITSPLGAGKTGVFSTLTCSFGGHVRNVTIFEKETWSDIGQWPLDDTIEVTISSMALTGGQQYFFQAYLEDQVVVSSWGLVTVAGGSISLNGQLEKVTIRVPTYSLTTSVSPNGSGSVHRNPNSSNYDTGTRVKLTATPDDPDRYQFTHWSGNLSGSTNPVYITMNSNKSVTANFKEIEKTNPPTSISGPSNTYVDKSESFTAHGASNNFGHTLQYRFDWGDGHVSSWNDSTTRSHEWDDDGTYYVRVQARCKSHTSKVSSWSTASKKVTVDYLYLNTGVSPGGAGYVRRNPDRSKYRYNETVELTAFANSLDYYFSYWTGDASGSSNPTYVTMNRNKNVTAVFAPRTPIVNPPTSISGPTSTFVGKTENYTASGASSNLNHSLQYRFNWGDGVISDWGPATQNHSWNNQSTYHVRAQARCASHTNIVSSWSGTLKSVTVTCPTLNILVNPPGGGTIIISPMKSCYSWNEQVQISAVPNPGYAFDYWSGDASGSSSLLYINMNSNKNITANFTLIEIVTTPTSISGPSSTYVNKTESYSASGAVSNVGHGIQYRFNWDDGNISGWGPAIQNHYWINSGSYNITAQARCVSDTSIVSSWSGTLKTVTVNFLTITTAVNPAGAGTITKIPDKSNYTYNESVTLTANDNTGWGFDHWTGDASGSSNPLTLMMNSNKSVTANFIEIIVTTPDTPSGPDTRDINQSGSYTTGGSVCSLGHPVEYRFDWDADGSHDYSSWGAVSQSHDWSTPGTYVVKAQARCQTNTDVISAWSPGLNIVVTEPETVSPPSSITGPTSSIVAKTENYVCSGASSSLSHTLQYRFDWGDGIISDWGGASQSHDWNTNGIFHIKAQARCTDHPTIESTWSGNLLTVSVSYLNLNISIDPIGAGTVTQTPDKTGYEYNETVQLEAISFDINFPFSYWSGDATGSINPTSIVMNSDKNVTAHFILFGNPPTAFITSITPPIADPNKDNPNADTILFREASFDNDQNGDSISTWEWSSNLGNWENNTVLSTAQNPDIPAFDLQVGVHTISLSVTDNEDESDVVIETDILEIIDATPVIDSVIITPEVGSNDIAKITASAHDRDEHQLSITEWKIDITGTDFSETLNVGVDDLDYDYDTTSLAAGTYLVALTAQDDENTWSQPETGSFVVPNLPADLDRDGDVDLMDLHLFRQEWPRYDGGPGTDWCNGADLNRSGMVDFVDYAIFAEQCSVPFTEDDLVGYWKFDETDGYLALDSSGYGNDGILVNDPNRLGSGALSFDGVDDYVLISDSASLTLSNEITVSLWVSLEEYGADFPKLVIKLYESYSGPWELFCLDLSHYGTYPRFIITEGFPGCDFAYAWDSNFTLDLHRWYHIVGTYDGQNVCLYVDGQLINSQASNILIGVNSMPISIGGRLDINNFNGLLDEVQIYNYGLSSAQVTNLYEQGTPLQHALDFASEQLTQTATTITATQYPSTTLDDYSDWITTGASSWTSGFFPGCLWYMYEYTGDASYRTWAESWMVDLEGQAANTTTHDLGFMILDSFGNGYRLTNNTAYKDVVLQAAGSLASRFNPTVGCTRSEDWGSWAFPVNIDNMMNLELLFWGAKNGVLPAWYDMAVSHAYRTMQDHVRADGSTYQFVDYDIATGDIIEKSTWGGYDVESTWSRGQAWGLYGFTVAYRETGDPNFLNTAIKVADYFVDNLPADYVPYWDFDAPTIPHTAKDASAAAIAASGLIELSTLVQAPLLSEKYSNAARNILTSLSTLESLGGYLAQDIDGNALSPGILMHGCDMHPDSHAGGDRPDRSQIYADYYFLEALLRFEGIKVP